MFVTSFVTDLQPLAQKDAAIKLNNAIYEQLTLEPAQRDATQSPLKVTADKVRQENAKTVDACIAPFHNEDHVISDMPVESAQALPIDIQCYLSDDIKEAIEVVTEWCTLACAQLYVNFLLTSR